MFLIYYSWYLLYSIGQGAWTLMVVAWALGESGRPLADLAQWKAAVWQFPDHDFHGQQVDSKQRGTRLHNQPLATPSRLERATTTTQDYETASCNQGWIFFFFEATGRAKRPLQEFIKAKWVLWIFIILGVAKRKTQNFILLSIHLGHRWVIMVKEHVYYSWRRRTVWVQTEESCYLLADKFVKALFTYCRIHLNLHVLEWIGVEFSSSSTSIHPNTCELMRMRLHPNKA